MPTTPDTPAERLAAQAERPLIYLASPYSHMLKDVCQQRFEIVCRVAGRLMRDGHLIYSPIAHMHPIAMVGELPTGWDFFEKYDRAMLDVCTEIWVLRIDGWDKSKGVAGELDYMQSRGKVVRYVDPMASDFASHAAELFAVGERPDAAELHQRIMNLPCEAYDDLEGSNYRRGHRDARHAAAELVLQAFASPPPSAPAHAAAGEQPTSERT